MRREPPERVARPPLGAGVVCDRDRRRSRVVPQDEQHVDRDVRPRVVVERVTELGAERAERADLARATSLPIAPRSASFVTASRARRQNPNAGTSARRRRRRCRARARRAAWGSPPAGSAGRRRASRRPGRARPDPGEQRVVLAVVPHQVEPAEARVARREHAIRAQLPSPLPSFTSTTSHRRAAVEDRGQPLARAPAASRRCCRRERRQRSRGSDAPWDQ